MFGKYNLLNYCDRIAVGRGEDILPIEHRPKVLGLVNLFTLRLVHFARGTWPWPPDLSIRTVNRLFSVTANPGGPENRIDDDASSHPLIPGRCYLVPAFHPTYWHLDERLRFVSIHFHLELHPGIDLLARYGRIWVSERPRQIQELDQRFQADNTLAVAMTVRRYVYGTMEELLWRDGRLFETAERFAAYQAVFDYFEAHGSAKLRISELARIMGCTRETFTRRFKADIGIGPGRFFARRLAQKGAELLRRPGMTAQIAAHELSFSDASAFSHFFKRHAGVSPRDHGRLNL